MSSYSTEQKNIRKFAIILLPISVVMGVMAGYRWGAVIQTIFFVFTAMAICLLVFPLRFAWFYSGWVNVTRFLGKIFTYLLLTVIWYTVITPFALIRKLLGKLPLPLSPDEKVKSYWVDRNETLQSKDRYEKRY